MSNSVVKLSIDSQEYDAKLKSASKALSDYFDIAKKGDRTFEVLDKGVLEAVQAIGKMETQTKSATGQLREMEGTFRDMSLVYRRLTDAEKQSPVGKELSKSLSELKGRISDTKKDLQAINQEISGSKFGQFGSVIDTIGHKMGLTANATELLTSKTALMYAGIGAGIAVIGKASSEWKKYNDELARQDQQTTVVTGLKGPEANYMTDTMRALVDTYKVDFRQAIEAANTLMSQFGVNGDEAIQLIKDGMQGMIQGDGPKLLQMIKQYAPAFRDAGVSASQLVAVIHNSEGGIFTDQNMNAIVMGIKNIRLMTKQTSDALAQLGLDGQEMSRKMSDGSMTVFDALKMVAEKLQNVESGSKTAGEVMQTVFGRTGYTAGTNLAKAIETLNTNLEQTKKQTGELGDAFADLQRANENLNTAIRETFSYDGWAEMSTGIKTTLITTLAEVIEKLGQVKSLIAGLTPGQARQNKYGSGGIPAEVKKDLAAIQSANEADREALYNQLRIKYEKRFISATQEEQKWKNAYDRNEESSNWRGIPFVRKALDRTYYASNVNTARSNVAAEEEILNLFRREAQKILNPEKTTDTKNNPRNPTIGNEIKKEIAALKVKDFSEINPLNLTESKAMLQEQLRAYQQMLNEATDMFTAGVAQKGLEDTQRLLDAQPLALKMGISSEAAAELKEQTESLRDWVQEDLNREVVRLGIQSKDGEKDKDKDDSDGDSDKFGDAIKTFQQVNSGIGQLTSGIQQLGIKLPEGLQRALSVMQGLASIASGISTLMSLFNASETASRTANTTAITTLTGAILANTAALEVNSVSGFLPFARGGIVPHAANGYYVPGNNFSGDTTPILANAGELILNRAAQGNLASILQDRESEGVASQPYVSGEQIFLAVNNYLRRSGRGEIVTAR